MKVEVDSTFMTSKRNFYIGRITDRSNSIQIRIDTKLLLKAFRIIQEMSRSGIDYIYITIGKIKLQSGYEIKTMIIGGKEYGFILVESQEEE